MSCPVLTYPVLELQTRWIAYTLSGAQAGPAKDELEAGIAAYRQRRGGRKPCPTMWRRYCFPGPLP